MVKDHAGGKCAPGASAGVEARSRSGGAVSRRSSCSQRGRRSQSVETFIGIPSKSAGESLCIVELSQDDRHAGQDTNPRFGE